VTYSTIKHVTYSTIKHVTYSTIKRVTYSTIKRVTYSAIKRVTYSTIYFINVNKNFTVRCASRLQKRCLSSFRRLHVNSDNRLLASSCLSVLPPTVCSRVSALPHPTGQISITFYIVDLYENLPRNSKMIGQQYRAIYMETQEHYINEVLFYYPINTIISILRMWFLFDTVACFGCPYQPSSGRGPFKKKKEHKRWRILSFKQWL